MTHFFSGQETMDSPLVSGGEGKGIINKEGVSFGLSQRPVFTPVSSYTVFE